MFTPLPTPEEMALWDRLSREEYGIRDEMLMENAAREAFSILREEFGRLKNMSALVFAGSGNNGGDAFAVARMMADHGVDVTVLHTRPKRRYTGATGYHMSLARKFDVAMAYLPRFDVFSLPQPDIVVDGLLGTGFKGELSDQYIEYVEIINRLGEMAFVFSLDIPSGLNGLSGHASPVAVRASATVTFEAAKLGLVQPEAALHTGALHVREIGIPARAKDSHPAKCGLLTDGVASLVPNVDPEMHKGHAGHVLVVGGSTGLTGAAVLAALGALRGGAGLVTVACPKKLEVFIKAANPEIMSLPLGQGEDWSEECADLLHEHLVRFDSVIIGPGLGRMEASYEFLKRFMELERMPGVPYVIDADGLYWLAHDKELFNALGAHDMLTPHPGEMERILMDTDAFYSLYHRIETARAFAEERGIVLVLKGAGTVVAAPPESGEQRVFLSPFTAPNLAVGGSGDVLSGLFGSLLARGMDALSAAMLGVYWHGNCGILLGREYPLRGNTARDIADKLPRALEELLDANS